MPGSINLYNTGKSALFANRASLATTGHNIANVNTDGYSRQRVEQTAHPSQQIGATVYGTGVNIKNIKRINDEYITRQIGKESKFLGQYEEKNAALTQAEIIFNEIQNEGMNRLITKFFNEFRKLGNEPESQALRATVKEAASQLTGDFHRVSRSLREIQNNLNVRIDANVRQTNELVERIAHLNEKVKQQEIHGSEAPDLRDKRDLAIRTLSEIIDVNVSTNERGELTIGLAGVGPLVSGVLINKLFLESSPADPETGKPEGGTSVLLENSAQPNITQRLVNGRLGGLIEARDKIIGQSANQVDELAFNFANKINEIHRQGFSINGKTGVDFFKPLSQQYAASEQISLGSMIEQDSNNIATAIAPDSPGDNRLIQMLAKVQHQKIMGSGQSTFDEHYNSTVASLATVTQKNKEVLEHQKHIVGQLDKFRESISGVSLDEETTNLVQFQHAFDASAKVIKVADEVLETILSLRK